MIDLYISYKTLENSLTNKKPEDILWYLISEKKVDVYVDLEIEKLNELILESEEKSQSVISSVVKDKNIPFFSGKERMNKVKSGAKIKPLPSNSIFIFDKITKSEIELISRQYGVICLAGDNILLSNATYSHFWDKDGKEEGSWETIINGNLMHYCNSIVFLDLYLWKDDKKFKNVLEILKSLCQNVEHQKNILFVWDDTANIDKARKVSTSIFNSFSNVRIEFILCNTSNDLLEMHEIAHNRKFLSNYFIGTAEYTLAAFNENGYPTKSQRLNFHSLFSKGDYSIEYGSYISKIVRDLKRNETYPPENKKRYTFWVCSSDKQEVQEQRIENLKNRIIMNSKNLKEGDRCYYLSVPNDNDWMNIEVKGDQQYYSNRFANCIVDKERKLLEIKAQEIKECFKGYEQATDDSDCYYRVTVSYASDLKTVHVLENRKTERIEDQKNNYVNNCFKNEEDAKKVVDEIKRILGIE